MIIENINNIIVCGDIHGENDISKLNRKKFPDQKNFCGNNILIQTGDFGFVWNSVPSNKLKNEYPDNEENYNFLRQSSSEKYWLNWLDNKPFYTLFIAGNHENFDRLEKYPLIDFHGGKAAQISKKVFYLKNGYVYDIDGLTFWVFGGATSIDKIHRMEGISWWSQETSNYSEMQFGLDNLKKYNYQVDYIITHTIPKTILQQNFPNKLVYPCPVSNYLDNVFDLVRGKYKHWYAGHFHTDKTLFSNIHVLYNNIKYIKETNSIINSYNNSVQKLYEHVGFTPDWIVFPIDDQTDKFWVVTKDSVVYGNNKNDIVNENSNYYIDEIYTHRFYDKSIYEGKELTMVMCNPEIDGMKWLRVFDNRKRIN